MPTRVPPDYMERLERAAAMVRGGTTQTEAAMACGVSTGRLSEYLRGLWPPDAHATMRRFEAECRDIVRRAYRGLTADARLRVRFPCRVVFADDLHVPFTDWDALARLIERERGADYLITFELITFDAFSRFDQTYLSDPLAEQNIGVRVLQALAENFGAIIEGTSNHMDRPEKVLVRDLRPEQQEYIRQWLHSVYDAVRDAGVTLVRAPLVQIGDAIFGHSDVSLFAPGAAARKLRNFALTTGRRAFGVEPPVSAVFTGHTHRLCQTFDTSGGWDGYLYEAGAMAHIQPYALRIGKRGRWNELTPAVGYAVATFDSRGRIDLTESRVVHLGWARLPEAAGRG